MQAERIQFDVHDDTVRGFFHFPDNAERKQMPVIVMMNGYATEWDFGTEAFIGVFTAAGMATLNFDYRYCGQSDGEPRRMVDIPAQLEDCRSAIRFVKSQPWYENNPLILWGSSLGGGHAISMASEHPEAKALIAQVPHCDSRAAMKTVKLSAILRGMGTAIADAIGALFGRPPIYVPVVGEPVEYAVMNHKGWKQHYLQIARNSTTWTNAIPARSLLRGGDYRPIAVAAKIQCPTLLMAGQHDAGVPVASVQATAALIDHADIEVFQGDHFDVYGGPLQSSILARQVSFLREKILCY